MYLSFCITSNKLWQANTTTKAWEPISLLSKHCGDYYCHISCSTHSNIQMKCTRYSSLTLMRVVMSMSWSRSVRVTDFRLWWPVSLHPRQTLTLPTFSSGGITWKWFPYYWRSPEHKEREISNSTWSPSQKCSHTPCTMTTRTMLVGGQSMWQRCISYPLLFRQSFRRETSLSRVLLYHSSGPWPRPRMAQWGWQEKWWHHWDHQNVICTKSMDFVIQFALSSIFGY